MKKEHYKIIFYFVYNIKKYKYLSEEQKQKRRDYQKQYTENITDEQKQKIKDYRKEYYKKYYIEKKLAAKVLNIFVAYNYKT